MRIVTEWTDLNLNGAKARIVSDESSKTALIKNLVSNGYIHDIDVIATGLIEFSKLGKRVRITSM